MRGSSESVLSFRSEVVLGMRGISATIVATAGEPCRAWRWVAAVPPVSPAYGAREARAARRREQRRSAAGA